MKEILIETSYMLSGHPQHGRLMELAEAGEWKRFANLLNFGAETQEEIDELPPPNLTGLQGIIDDAGPTGYDGLTR